MAKLRRLVVKQPIGKRDCCGCRLRNGCRCLAFDVVLQGIWYAQGYGWNRCQACLDAEKAGRGG